MLRFCQINDFSFYSNVGLGSMIGITQFDLKLMSGSSELTSNMSE